MTLKEAYVKIEKGLIKLTNEKLLDIFHKLFPEEIVNSSDCDEGFKEEIVQIIIENLENDLYASIKLYKIIFNEKIILEEDYSYEEQELWQ